MLCFKCNIHVTDMSVHLSKYNTLINVTPPKLKVANCRK